MRYGYRITREEQIGLYPVDLVQISIYRGVPGQTVKMEKLAAACRSRDIRYVIHPLGYFLSETRTERRAETFEVLRMAAEQTDLGLILHDERSPSGGRLEGQFEKAFRKGLSELSSLCAISLENANDTPDVEWFWKKFAPSITIDIGHIEVAGIDSIEFMRHLSEDLVRKTDFVHLHRVNGYHDGLRDHWGIDRDCRELKALDMLLQRRSEIAVILEINDMETLEESLELLKERAHGS